LFVDLPVSAFVSFFFSFGLGCAAAPTNLVVLCGCYINIVGQKPVSRELENTTGDGNSLKIDKAFCVRLFDN
jgi:hypothetical protein